MRARLRSAGAALLLLAAPAALLAHNFWVEPATLFPRSGARLDVSLCIGHHREVEFYARNPRHAAEFYVLKADRTKVNVAGEPGAQPAGHVESMPEGPAWIVYRSNFSSSELEPARFEAYLQEEGLEHVVAERTARGESERPGRERYARAAKALLVASADGGSAGAMELPEPTLAPVGLPAELVLKSNPLVPAPPDTTHLALQLLVDGEPRSGALVTLQLLAADVEAPPVHRARTDDAGVAKLPWPQAGQWLATTVHMVRADGEADFEWRSHFVSLRFDVPGGSGPAGK
ncbi:MAG: DUF4198 domain-containing protein [Planctomycetaceae bacterium]|nr:DUF4198 domain-containing protein [Planctomycetaceae bacterium]